jgi:hypothetical protein
VNLAEPRIKAGVLLAAPGRGGDALTEFAAENYPFFSTTDFSEMTTPALVVAGDKDTSPHLTVAGADWHTDPYFLSPGPKSLLTMFDAEHGLGGVSGYDVAETTDENPERVAAVQRLSWAYLRTELCPGDSAWQAARDALTAGPNPLGRVESKTSSGRSPGAPRSSRSSTEPPNRRTPAALTGGFFQRVSAGPGIRRRSNRGRAGR